MENVNKSENPAEGLNGELSVKYEEGNLLGLKMDSLVESSDNFIKHEGNNEIENRVLGQNNVLSSVQENETNPVSSLDNNAETSPIPSPVSRDPNKLTEKIGDAEISGLKDSKDVKIDNVSEFKDMKDSSYLRKGDVLDEINKSHLGAGSDTKVENTAPELLGDDRSLPAEKRENINEKGTSDWDSDSCVKSSGNTNTKEPPEEWMDILGSGHLMKKVLKPGIPNTRPQKSDICKINLVGQLEDGTIVEQYESLEINHSDNDVIQGLDFALALMDKGEEAEIKITPRFGYGTLGKKPEIPPNANLIYKVELLDVVEEPLIQSLTVTERIKNGLKKKERGNWWYSRDENTLAINCYRRALDYLDDTEIPQPYNEEELRKLLEERLKTYNNLGAAQMKISAFDAALMSVNNVLAAQPENVKALFRKAKILKEKGDLQESVNVVKQALSYEPDSQTLQQELSSLLAAQRKANTKQRELYKKMMGNSSNQPDEEDKKKSSKNNYKTFTLVAAVSFAVAVLGTIVVKYKL